MLHNITQPNWNDMLDLLIFVVNDAYFKASYGWHIDMPAITLFGRFWRDSPRYLVTKLPPMLYPMIISLLLG